MLFHRFTRKFHSADAGGGTGSGSNKKRYGGVRLLKVEDGTVIEGHDAITAFFDQEQQMYEEHGPTITFQVYRMNLSAKTLEELQGEKLAEFKLDGKFVSDKDTVAAVKKKLRPLLEKESRRPRLPGRDGILPGFHIGPEDRVNFVFSDRTMRDDRLFYADHFMMLPVWVQVILYDCEFEELKKLVAKLGKNKEEKPDGEETGSG